MSATPKSKPPVSNKKDASDIPVVNVFDEEVKSPQPMRKPVVVEIEDVAPEPEVTQPEVDRSSLPAPMEVSVEPSQESLTPPPVVSTVAAPAATEPMVSFGSPLEAPQAPAVQPTPTPEPALPSFFEHDLKGDGVVAPASSSQPVVNFGVPVAQDATFPTDGALPQAVVGEIHEINEGGSKKKMIGIILIILAIILLGVGAFVVYSRMQTQNAAPEPTPIVQTTPAPSIVPSATPAASESGSLIATDSAEFIALKKKYKVDVLNGTKVAGLASKHAATVKTEGYTTGTVGNGETEKAGTIIVPTGAASIGKDIARILQDFTFTVTEDTKATAVIVTLGEPN